jgi:hypothetical protein
MVYVPGSGTDAPEPGERRVIAERCLSAAERYLSVVKRSLSVVERCLSVTERYLSVVKRSLFVAERYLSAMDRTMPTSGSEHEKITVRKMAVSIRERAKTVPPPDGKLFSR